MNKKQFLLYKKLFSLINHHQLLDEYVLHNFFCFLSNIINCQKQLKTIQQTVNKKKCTFFLGVCIMSIITHVTPFLNETSISKSFCSLRSGFQRAIYDATKFFLVVAFFGAFEMTAHVK